MFKTLKIYESQHEVLEPSIIHSDEISQALTIEYRRSKSPSLIDNTSLEQKFIKQVAQISSCRSSNSIQLQNIIKKT